MDSYGSLMLHNSSDCCGEEMDRGIFRLENTESERIAITWEEATLDLNSFEVVFKENKTGKFERFTVLTVPNGKNLLDLIS